MPKKRGVSKEGVKALFGGAEKEEEAKVEVKVEERDELLDRAVEHALRNPRVSVHSPLTSAVMRYLKLERPNFSISSELREVLEKAVKEKYPELAERVSKALIEVKEKELRRRYGAV